MAATLTKTLKGGNFDGIFTEVPHAETLGLRNPEALRLFHLDVVNYAFNTAGLHKFLSRNIGQYVFSRAKLEKYRVDDDIESVAYDALSLMHQNGSPDEKGTGNELGEILLYAFLEEKLGAPKIMSKVELNTTVKQYSSKCDSIHLLPFEDSCGFPYYQMVFGTSSIIGDLKDAIDCAFDRIVQIESGSGNEIQMIESTALDHIFNEETSKALLDILVPSKENNATYDSAYGVFLGYTLGLNPARYSSVQFRQAVVQKMTLDIKNHAAYIAQKIKDLSLDGHSFYFYILPLNDAEADKKDIMEKLLLIGGGS